MIDWEGHLPQQKQFNFLFAGKTTDPGNDPGNDPSEVVSKCTFPGNVHSDTTKNNDFMGPKPHMMLKSGCGLYQNANS